MWKCLAHVAELLALLNLTHFIRLIMAHSQPFLKKKPHRVSIPLSTYNLGAHESRKADNVHVESLERYTFQAPEQTPLDAVHANERTKTHFARRVSSHLISSHPSSCCSSSSSSSLPPLPLLLLQLPPSIQNHLFPPLPQQRLPLVLVITPRLRLRASSTTLFFRRRRRRRRYPRREAIPRDEIDVLRLGLSRSRIVRGRGGRWWYDGLERRRWLERLIDRRESA